MRAKYPPPQKNLQELECETKTKFQFLSLFWQIPGTPERNINDSFSGPQSYFSLPFLREVVSGS
jgi:hypothetical protein